MMKMMIIVMMAVLIASVSGQTSPSSTASASLGSASGSASVASASASPVAPSASGTAGVPSLSGTNVAPTPSNSGTYPLPPPATTLTNNCPREDGTTAHTTYLCPTWVDASGRATSWTISVNGGAPITVTTPIAIAGNFPGTNQAPLLPSTVYTFIIIQIDAAGRQSLPYTASLTTSAATPKTTPAADLQNVACTIATSNSTLRPSITCSWGQATPVAPTQVVVRARCVAPIFVKNKFIKKYVPGTTTSVTLYINRALATCTIRIVGHYPNPVGNVYAEVNTGKVFKKTCLVGSATTCS